VPEATVYEDRYPRGSKDEVRAPAALWQSRLVDSEAKALAVHHAAYRKLRSRVAPPHRLHPPAHVRRRRLGPRRRHLLPLLGTFSASFVSIGMTSPPKWTISSGGTALPIIVASAVRGVSVPKRNQSGNV